MARKILKRTDDKKRNHAKRKFRVRSKISGSTEQPRLCVTKTNRGLNVQIVDDEKGITLFGVRSAFGQTVNSEKAKELGKNVAAKAQEKGLSKIVFDRSGNRYHGRVKAFADGVREGGLNI